MDPDQLLPRMATTMFVAGRFSIKFDPDEESLVLSIRDDDLSVSVRVTDHDLKALQACIDFAPELV